MKCIVLFGLPGAGKTFTGIFLQKTYGFYLHDGDQDIPDEMKKKIEAAEPITDDMRDIFFQQLIEHAAQLLTVHQNIIISQTFIKDKYRKQLLERIPNAKFFLIESESHIREKRLKERTDYPLDSEYANKMSDIFDRPSIPHIIIQNDADGSNMLYEQFNNFLTI